MVLHSSCMASSSEHGTVLPGSHTMNRFAIIRMMATWAASRHVIGSSITVVSPFSPLMRVNFGFQGFQ